MKTMTYSPVMHRTRFRLRVEGYAAQRFQTAVILLHFADAISARSICKPWGTRRSGQTSRTRSAYVIDLNGAIYKMCQPEFWIRQMGMNSDNPGAVYDRRTIAIDNDGAGPLRFGAVHPNQLNWWPNGFGARFCGTEGTEKYVVAGLGSKHCFAAFPEARKAAVRFLVERQRRGSDIPAVVAPLAKRWNCDPEYFLAYRGIAARQNFRVDRFDSRPMFDWRWLGA